LLFCFWWHYVLFPTSFEFLTSLCINAAYLSGCLVKCGVSECSMLFIILTLLSCQTAITHAYVSVGTEKAARICIAFPLWAWWLGLLQLCSCLENFCVWYIKLSCVRYYVVYYEVRWVWIKLIFFSMYKFLLLTLKFVVGSFQIVLVET
jgi:hypothetical protein